MKKMIWLVAFAAAGVFAADEKAKSILLDGVAAYVNNDVITIAEVMTEVRRSMWEDMPEEQREKHLKQLYQATLNALVDRKLILAASKEAKIQLQPWAVDGRIREIIDQHFDGDKSKLSAALAQRQMTYEEWEKSIKDDLTLSMMRHAQVDQKVNLSPGQIRSYYEAHKNEFTTEGGVRIRLIVLKNEVEEDLKKEAATVVDALKKGEKFAEVAKKYSKDDKARLGGEWGLVQPAEVFAPPLVSALEKVPLGQYTEPVFLGGNCYILLKEENVAVKPLDMSDAWKMAEMKLRFREQEKMYRIWTERLRSKAYIKVMELPDKKK